MISALFYDKLKDSKAVKPHENNRMMNNARSIIEKFPKAKILVIGDLILDEYIKGDVERISPEAPVPVVRVKDHFHAQGGAANVASNLASFGASVTLAGVVGNAAAGAGDDPAGVPAAGRRRPRETSAVLRARPSGGVAGAPARR